MSEILNILNWLAVNVPWEAVLASGVLSALLMIPKRWVKRWFKHSDQVMILLVGASGIVTAVGNYLMNVPTTSPQIVALQGLALSFGTQPFYHFMVKPAWTAVGSWISSQVAEATIRQEAQSALEPVTGLPVTASPSEDFAA